jgi:hypothetical protein
MVICGHPVSYSEGCALLASPEEMDIQISIQQSADDQEIDIVQRCCQESHRTLGVHDNPASIYKTEYAHLLAKGNNMAQLISAQAITRPDAWIAYRRVYLPSLSYSLPSTSFPRQDLATIQRNSIHVLLSAMGFNNNIPLALVCGPAYLGGIGLQHLLSSRALKASTLIELIRHNGRLGKMMWIAIQWAQVTAGVGFALLGTPERFIPHAIGKWLLSLRDFLADSEFTLEIVNTYTVSLRRVHDRILMDDVLAGFYTDSETQGINRCRLYLQVECLSDIYTADGVSLDPRLRDKPPTVTSASTIQWPRQGLPGPRSWAIWRRFLKTYTRDSASNRPRHTLGSWTKPNLRAWHTYYDPSSQMLCQYVSSTATTGTKSSWNYYPAYITGTRDASSQSQRATYLQMNALTSTRYPSRYF